MLALQNLAIKKKLWLHREWLNLVHYSSNSFSLTRYSSQADDKAFFNAADGKSNPKSELLATLSGFYRTDISSDDHPQCRFVARFAWLKQQIAASENTFPIIHCKKYEQWHKQVNAESATMIFPTYHLNSPSSMFGHTLLRLDPSAAQKKSDWLSFAVNFGANTSNQDNSIFYAYKGLTGAYPGLFIVTPYFKKIREYNRIEKRDIWEYSLNLMPDEVERMVMHLWELQDINFDYYFFDENCSYRLLELLEVARPSLMLTNDFKLTAIPVDTIKAIEAAGLIEKARYRPSQVTELKVRLNLLNDQERSLVEKISENASRIEQRDYLTKSPDIQIQLLDAAYRYLRIQKIGAARNKETAKHSFQLLASLNGLHVQVTNPRIALPVQPEKGHHSRRATIGVNERNNNQYGTLAVRLGFHSLDDNLQGFLPGAQINMVDLKIRLKTQSSNIEIDKLDIIDIFSLSNRTQFFKSWSWRIRTGFERQIIEGKDALVAQVNGGGGFTYALSGSGRVYFLATSRFERAKEKQSYLVEPALGATNGVLWHFSSSTANLEASINQFVNGNYRAKLTYQHNFVLTRNQSIKLSISEERQENIRFMDSSISYQYYFY